MDNWELFSTKLKPPQNEEPRFPELGSGREIVSERNGDKARFGRERKKKILLRKRSRELRKALKKNVKGATPA
jgi:hypothetical protein